MYHLEDAGFNGNSAILAHKYGEGEGQLNVNSWFVPNNMEVEPEKIGSQLKSYDNRPTVINQNQLGLQDVENMIH